LKENFVVSGIHLTAEPREGFVRTATAGFRETKCLGVRAHSLPESSFALCSWFPHWVFAPCEVDIVCLDCSKNTNEIVFLERVLAKFFKALLKSLNKRFLGFRKRR
jgi:hypothetical protein